MQSDSSLHTYMRPSLFRTGVQRTALGALLFCLYVLTGCENLGPVGNTLPGSDTELSVDTLQIVNVGTEELNIYSGQRTFVSLGRYDDPLFGSTTASAYVKPVLLSTTSSDTVEEDAAMKLRLVFDRQMVYGDSLQPGNYDIYEIDQMWRGKAWRLKDAAAIDESYTVGSFTLETEDSLDVQLDPQWVEKYRSHYTSSASNRDSLYRRNFHGLAVIPRDNSNILPLEADNIRFVVENPDEDTVEAVELATGQWAYSLERGEDTAYPEGRIPLFSTYEQILHFNLGLEGNGLSISNISKAELVFFVDNATMEVSLATESESTVRPRAATLQLHLADPSEVPESIDPGNPIAVAGYDNQVGAYRFTITSFARAVLQNQIPAGEKLYLTIENNGTVKPTLIQLNDDSNSGRNPQLIVTSVKNTNSSN